MKREAGYLLLGLILAAAVTMGYYQLTRYAGVPITNQILRETTAKTELDLMGRTTSIRILSVTVFVVALVSACFTYGVAKKRSS